MKKTVKSVWVAGTILLLGACNGWPDTVPFQDAENKPEKYVTYAGTAGHPVEFYAGNRRFLVLPVEFNLRGARTRPVSTAEGVGVFSLDGDEAPYASLFARGGDGRTHVVAAID